jgi:predicted nuclease of predicted toxin-antitoxin system
MTILIDLNLSSHWLAALDAKGIEAYHWSEMGRLSASDTEVVRKAAESGWLVMTKDFDFGHLLASPKGGRPSVLLLRALNTSPEALGPTLFAALKSFQQELQDGALVTIQDHLDVRVLPYRSE